MTIATTDGRIMQARVARLAEELDAIEAMDREIGEAREALSAMIRERDHEVSRIGERLVAMGRTEVHHSGHIYHFKPGGGNGIARGQFHLTIRPVPDASDVILGAPEDAVDLHSVAGYPGTGAAIPDGDLLAGTGGIPGE